MSAHDIYDDKFELQPGQSTQSKFSSITQKISGGLEQLAGTIHEKVQGLKNSGEESTLTGVGERTASMLHSSASYLKQADFDQMKTDLHSTIKRNPERSVLIGLGVGILLGSILRKRG